MSSSGWTTNGSLDVADYYQFTITPAAATILNIDNLYFAERRSGTGIAKFELRSSLDNYSTAIGSAVTVPDDTVVRQQILALGTAFDSVSSAVTFRLYGYAAEAGGGTWRIENNAVKAGLVLEGSPVAPAGTLSVALETNPIFESGGATSTSGTVTRTGDLTNSLTVNLSSSDPAQATVSSATITIPAEAATSNPFTVTAVNDTLPDGNVAVTISASAPTYTPGTASLTVNDDGDLQPVLISQYYEGASGTNRYIELYNPNATPSTLTGFVLTSWNNTSAEAWKTNGNTPTSQTSLSAVTVPALGYYLIKATGAVTPSYAASSADLDSAVTAGFDGNDSIVLYSSSTFNTSNIIDAVSFTNAGNEGLDKSFYRSGTATGYNLIAGSSVLTFPGVWISKLLSEVNTAAPVNAWYLQGSVVLESLSLTFTPDNFFENAGAAASTARVTRSGPTTNALEVTISVDDPSEAAAQTSVTIPANETFADFPINAVNDEIVDGNKTVTITVQATSFISDSKTITVKDDGTDPATFTNLVINEVDSDTPGADVLEFVELYNKTNQSQSLNGLVLVFYNGGDISSYRTIDLSGQTIPANGFFVIGNSGVSGADLTFTNGDLQNGADAVALYAAEPAQFPNGTQVTSAPGTLVDAVVYDTDDADNTLLIGTLTPGEPQINENINSSSDTESMSRVPDGGAPFDTSLYAVQAPTPGATNVIAPPGNTFASWIGTIDFTGFTNPDLTATGDPDNDGLDNALENIFGTSPAASSQGLSAVSTGAGTLKFRHTRNASPASDLTASYEWSPDLVNWYASGVGAGGVTVTFGTPAVITPGPPALVEVTATVSGTAPKVFARVKVQ